MKVCAKCGWQNEDDEKKCFQCYADLIDEPTAVKKKADKKASVTVEEPESQDTTSEESVDVWNDPDMRPIRHLDDEPAPAAESSPTVRVVEEEEVVLDEVESSEEGTKIPAWAMVAIVAVFILLAVLIGRAFAREPEGSPQTSVAFFMDSVFDGNTDSIRACTSSNSGRLIQYAPLVLGPNVGRAIVMGGHASYSIDRVEMKDSELALVWCHIIAEQPIPDSREVRIQRESLPVVAKVEKGKWVVDLNLTAIRTAVDNRKKTGPPAAVTSMSE